MKGKGWFWVRGRHLRAGWHYRYGNEPDVLFVPVEPSPDGSGVVCAMWVRTASGRWHDTLSDSLIRRVYDLRPLTVFEEDAI